MAVQEQRIQIARRREIEENRLVAERLLKDRPFLRGELVMVEYEKPEPDFKTGRSTGVLIAIGTEDGTGEGCFRIVSIGSEVPISGVSFNTPPDVSLMYWGNLYLFVDSDKKVYYSYKIESGTDGTNGRRVETEIPINKNIIFSDLSSGYRWFYSGGNLKREDDYYSSTELVHIVEEVQKSNDVIVNVTPTSGSNIYTDGSSYPISIIAQDTAGNNLTGDYDVYVGDYKVEDPSNFDLHPNPNQDTTYVIRVVYEVEGVTMESSTTFVVYAGIPIYYGTRNESWSPENINLNEFSKTLIRSCDNHAKITSWNLGENEGDPSRELNIPVVITKNYKVKHIYDYSGLDYIEDYKETRQGNLYIYQKKTGFVASNFLQDFWFIDKE